MGKDQHVTPHPSGGWQVKAAVNKKATAVNKNQKEANNKAILIAKNEKSEVVIHGKDGKIRDKDSYGNDPSTPDGFKKLIFNINNL